MTGFAAQLLDRAPLLVVAACLTALGTVFAMEHLGGIIPCPLCIIQRWPWGVALVLAAMALTPRTPGTADAQWRLAMAGCAIAFLIAAAVGGYHTGIEQGWLQGPSSCTGAPARAATLEALRAQLMATPVVRCDEIAWSLFGISLAGYNAISAAGMFTLTAAAALRNRTGPTP